MKKLFIAIISLAFLLAMFAPASFAKKAGDVKDGVYFDNDHEFSFKVPDGWSTGIKKGRTPLRMIMTQESYPVPQDYYGGGEDYAQIPTITLLVDTTSLDNEGFFKYLIDPTDEQDDSKQRQYFMRYLDLISRPHDVLGQRKITVDGENALIVSVRQAYEREVATSRGSDRAKVINDFTSGNIFICVHGGKVYVFHMQTEYQLSNSYNDFWGKIVGSINFTDNDAETAEKKK